MRDYGKVHSSFWSSPTIRPLSEDGRLLALYLLTSAHSTIAGVFRIPDGYASEDLPGWTVERVREGFRELLAKGFANRCETTKWVWIVKHLKWNPPDNPNQRKAAAKVAAGIPDECSWKPEFMRVCGPSLGLEQVAGRNGSGTVGEPSRNQEQEQEQKAEDRKQETEGRKQERDGNAKSRASRSCPPDFTVTPAMREWAKQKTPALDIDLETEKFRLHEQRRPVTDWPRAWKNWALKGAEFAATRKTTRRPTSHSGFDQLKYHEGIDKDGRLL